MILLTVKKNASLRNSIELSAERALQYTPRYPTSNLQGTSKFWSDNREYTVQAFLAFLVKIFLE